MNGNPDSAPLGDSYRKQWKALSAWFLGPRGENWDVFMDTFKLVFKEHIDLRKSYFPSDPAYITDEMKSSDAYKSEINNMKEELLKMLDLMKGSVPFFSPRYQGHMNWDVTMPALLGYMAAMLCNQNNVDSAASPVTTGYEQQVGRQLCDMLGYNINQKDDIHAWGHITCGGSIANIEALWASRNIKYVPLAVRSALESQLQVDDGFITKDQVEKALMFELEVYDGGMKKKPLKDCTTWQLLNLEVDTICSLPEAVMDSVLPENDPAKDSITSSFKAIVEKEGVMEIGLFQFMKKHSLKNPPVYTAPANNHYSWPKAGTLLGLGSDALIPIELDSNFRQNVSDLRKQLDYCLSNEIPVLSVTAVIGSTEESAVDPIKDIHELRNDFKARGLDFALLADAAWGGYFKTMLKDSPGIDEASSRRNEDEDGFVPYCELSEYVTDQYNHIQLADTITIDPHKSGFCPYPGGALCYRNGKMRYPIALFHPEVFHGEDDPTMGVYGIEGSKPGASPAGILMSHNVIGLSNRGYGRILGQCTATAKLFYYMWLTLARDDDPFICVPLQDAPKHYRDFKEKIAYGSMADIYRDKEVRNFIKDIGPDTLINSFVVNIKDNTDVKLANKLQVALSDAMNIYVGTDSCRVPLMVMQSSLDAKKHGEGLRSFKRKAGLSVNDNEDLNVMVNSCMNPWQWNESIFAIGDLFRMIVLNCIGRVKDKELDVQHQFLMSGKPSFVDEKSDGTFFLEYLTRTDIPEHQYQVSIKVKVDPQDERALWKYIDCCDRNNLPVLLETGLPRYDTTDDNLPNLYNIIHLSDWDKDNRIPWKLQHDPNGAEIHLTVLDVPRYQRLDLSSSVSKPEKQRYFIYGDSDRTIMSHVMSKLPDFRQSVTLARRPHSLTDRMLKQGVMAEVEKIQEPLKEDSSYDMSFKGELYATICSTAEVRKVSMPATILSV